jgi:serine/threonine-protein kinase
MAYLGAMIGPYTLEPDGVPRVGGMGEVHFARHAASGLPVAIKVLPAFLAARAEARAAFLDEVRHTARLCHPNVVALDDFGTLPDGPAAGSPWLAMERADGALDRLALPRDWPTLQARLRAILLGLAHAHACGLLHLDLKPSNVLVFGAAGPAPRLALADFGIARLFTEPGEAAHSGAGTPAYMAPEQFSPQHGALGPPADVYAVGCLAHALVTGRAPFEGPTWFEYARQHLGVTPPPLAPRFAVPGAFAGWLALLLRKSPEARPACAADALHALATVGEAVEIAGTAPAVPSPSALAATAAGPTEPGVGPTPPVDGGQGIAASPADAPAPIAPCPDTWVDPARADWRPWSPGPGLYPLRRLPLVGRAAARDALWAALRAVATTRRPRVCVLRGGLGVGKSALLAWLGERAHETGAAVVAVAQGGEIGRASCRERV